ncbi:MAG: glutamine--fructose-6-phosphate transaminase (isomerizing) [Candidatus Omnitrophica bacterium]|nr:glutamine--fructose-6-phosphate transaminase (isomerizing) [Candidatus Omnitrophota bacterium]
MCGIIGYVGTRDASPILIESLKKLEYRGYDSSGIGLLDHQSHLIVRKSKGKIKNLEELLRARPLPFSNIGISHTRWATHGLPCDENAHPHTDSAHHIAVVHNGIIENYAELREKLKKQGCRFLSQTDTEVIAHLISVLYKGDLKLAVQKAMARLKGAFAIGVISKDHPDMLIAARVGSPLIIGLGDKENYIASDVPAILDRTRRVIYLKDGQMAVLSKGRVEVFTFDGKKVRLKVDTVSFTVGSAQKEGYDHFMLKEIHEQPAVIAAMLKTCLPAGRAAHQSGKLKLEGLTISDKALASIKKITVVACGTAYHAGLVGKYVLEALARLSVEVDTSSEFRYRNAIIDKHTLMVAVSQSGETADTLAAVREARAKGAKVISICNVIGSSLTRESDGVLYTHAGPEIGVASTKAYTAQLMMFYLLSLKLAQVRHSVPVRQQRKLIKDLQSIPKLYREVLKTKTTIVKIAQANSHFGCFLYLGRNINYPTALEGALKLKEISYIPAEGYAAGEMKHGPIALIDEYRAVICIAVRSHVYEKMISNIQEIRARKGNVIVVATRGDRQIAPHADYVIEVPFVDELLSPLLTVIPLQLIAYYIAVKRGNDVDQPRNLAKSVTVE